MFNDEVIDAAAATQREALLSLRQAHALFAELGYSHSKATLRRWIRDGTLPAYRPGPRKHIWIAAADIRAVVAREATRR